MKNLFIILFLTIFAMSCEEIPETGITEVRLNGIENDLPAELKGLKVYSVKLTNWVKVAVLNDNVNSLTYMDNKRSESVIIMTPDNRVIKADEIISETSDIIVTV